ncbi:MAG: DUF6586 family protein [Pseudomonadota bacterium]|nr:DUF6586 family protein [Pseudomonadota bacterium]
MSRVARYHADRTNQKLYFARLACKEANQTANVQAAQGAREAAVFHLHGAVLAFLQELVRYYKIDGDRQPTLTSVKAKMAERTQVSPEITILEQLSRDGFLAELSHAYLACQYAPEPPEATPDDEGSSNLILKVTQSPQAWLPDVQILREWHKSLTQLIEGFRGEMIEF